MFCSNSSVYILNDCKENPVIRTKVSWLIFQSSVSIFTRQGEGKGERKWEGGQILLCICFPYDLFSYSFRPVSLFLSFLLAHPHRWRPFMLRVGHARAGGRMGALTKYWFSILLLLFLCQRASCCAQTGVCLDHLDFLWTTCALAGDGDWWAGWLALVGLSPVSRHAVGAVPSIWLSWRLVVHPDWGHGIYSWVVLAHNALAWKHWMGEKLRGSLLLLGMGRLPGLVWNTLIHFVCSKFFFVCQFQLERSAGWSQ